jgi:hypothetical protein
MSDAFDAGGFGMAEGGNTPTAAPASKGTVKVKNTNYAVGLYWEGVDDSTDAASHARERADNADFFCVYKAPNKTQVGFANRSQGHKSNMPSLAIHIASGRAGRFLALFAVEDGFYVLGVREDGINPLLERFIGNREEAMDLFEDAKADNWDEMIAPNAFGWKDTTEVHIDDCLRGRPPVRLKDIKRGGSLVKILALALIVGVSIFGFQYWQQLGAEEQARLAAEAEAIRSATTDAILPGQEQKVEIPEAPWVNQTLGSYFLKKCVEDIMEFPLDIPGWKVTNFICENPVTPVAAAVLTRSALGAGGGPITWVEPYVKAKSYAPRVLQNSTGSTDTISAQWELFNGDTPKVPIDQVTLPVNQVKTKLVQIMESRFTPVMTSTTEIGGFYLGLDFSFDTDLDPRVYLDVLSAIPGAVIEGIEFDIETNIWKIKGKSYEQLPLPTQVQN